MAGPDGVHGSTSCAGLLCIPSAGDAPGHGCAGQLDEIKKRRVHYAQLKKQRVKENQHAETEHQTNIPIFVCLFHI